MEKFYTCDRVADRYGVTVKTVWEWIKSRKIPAVKIGKQYRITEDDLDTFEKSNRTVPTDEITMNG